MKMNSLPYIIVQNQLYQQLQTHKDQKEEELKIATQLLDRMAEGEMDLGDLKAYEHVEVVSRIKTLNENLRKIKSQEEKRHWEAEGLARFNQLLRGYEDNISGLCNRLINELVKYIEANQGGVFLIKKEENTEKEFLELEACYAYERKKYLHKKIQKGEGLLGQAWLEKDRIFMTEIPSDYVNITSGLGLATPNALAIIPIRLNHQIFGMVEIASFQKLEGYQIQFIEKMLENVSSIIASVQTANHTQNLLKETQYQAEMLRTQEEEMRQNMEELQSTQEEMNRKQNEIEAANVKMKNNEQVLKKAFQKSKKTEQNLKIEVEQYQKKGELMLVNLENTKDELKEAQLQLEKKEKENVLLKQSLERVKLSSKSLEQEKEKLNEKIENLKKHESFLRNEVNIHKEKTKEHLNQRMTDEEKLTDLRESKQQLHQNLLALQKQYHHSQEALENTNSEKQKMATELFKANEKNIENQNRIQKLEEELKKLKNRN
ncbi:GAF domain-containing protein [Sediminitomix flava]|uniref:GAF domain-containing protein n=1 Tax=Sediminitomix flava TaxID=379075 RepID=A0A315ZJA2_SEDFL|nr:GAF domain-containing protein [Sediminitomix flava]PWJ44918.1 GAF domain-containing protein [Sediminitomix flava]